MDAHPRNISVHQATVQTERVLQSRVFAKAARSQRLLRYLVNAALADPPQTPKEYTLAADVFDCRPGYDPSVDSTVRVEAGRLRNRLREYYDEEGRTDPLLIEVPKGGYRAVLTRREAFEDLASITPAHLALAGALPALEEHLARRSDTEDSGKTESAGKKSSSGLWLELSRFRMIPGRAARRFLLPLAGCGLLVGYGGWRLKAHSGEQPTVHSMAVLPLKNLSGDPEQEYFADGTTDELITELARVPNLRVISWNSVLQEKDTRKPLQKIAEELHADVIVEGSVSRSGENVRINTQLVDTRTDNHLWASSFEGRAGDMMTLESTAAQEIADHMRLVIAPKGRSSGRAAAASQPAIPREAHDAYLRGLNYFDKRQTRASAEEYQHAIDLDPGYALAYSGLALALESDAFMGGRTMKDSMPVIMAAINKALELDPDNGDALIARGIFEFHWLRDWKATERDLALGTIHSPNNSYGQMMTAVYLDALGRTDEAVERMQHAVEIDPLSFYMARHYGSTLLYARRYDEAVRQLLYARAMHPAASGVVNLWICATYEKMGRYDDAVRYDLLELQGDGLDAAKGKLLETYRRQGWKAYWALRLQQFDPKNRTPNYVFNAIVAAVRAGKHEQAIEMFRVAEKERCYWTAGAARADPRLDDLRGDPRFDALVRNLNLPSKDNTP